MIFNMYVNSIDWLILQEESSTRSAIPPGLCQLLFCTLEQNLFSSAAAVSSPPGQALAAIFVCDGLQWWSLSCDQCSGLWGFQRSCTSLILTGTPRGTTPTPPWRGPRSCCLLSIILRFVTLPKWLLKSLRYPLQLAIAAGTWEKVCGCDQEGL